MRKIIFLILAAMLAIPATAQIVSKEFAYKGGEELSFNISFRAALWPNTEMGKVVFKVSDDNLDGLATYKVDVSANTTAFRLVYKMDDYYTTWIDKSTARPVLAKRNISEGNYQFNSDIVFDWEKMEARSRRRNLKWDGDARDTLQITASSWDAIGFFFALRSVDFDNLPSGERRNFDMVKETSIRTMQYRYEGKEEKEVKGLGKVKTLKLACQITDSEGNPFEDGDEFYVWLTDDRNKVPVYLESPVKVGSIRARLVSYKNLKFPKDSVLQ